MLNVAPGLDTDSFNYLQGMVLDRSAIVLDRNKAYLIESRLMPVARQNGLASLAELTAALRRPGSQDLHREVIEAMTTHETSFFRDVHPFDALQTTVLPQLIAARSATRTLNIWCAACSTGQEPYTIAMILREHFPALANWTIRLTATDLSSQILDRAREAVFTQTEVNRGLPASLLVKYFQKSGLKWKLRDDIRRMVQFSEMNLAEAWPAMPRAEIVFLRNVLIYFSSDTKRDILRKTERMMAGDGYLFLGGAESTLNLNDAFFRVPVGKTCCYRMQRTATVAAPIRTATLNPTLETKCSI